MTEDELQTFLFRLKERRADLLAAGDFKLDPNRKDASSLPDEDEQPLNEMQQVIASRRNTNRALEIDRIDGAIRAIHDDPDEFGLCAHCEEEIPFKRLELMPWAKMCVKCKSLQDEGLRGYKRGHAGDFIK